MTPFWKYRSCQSDIDFKRAGVSICTRNKFPYSNDGPERQKVTCLSVLLLKFLVKNNNLLSILLPTVWL